MSDQIPFHIQEDIIKRLPIKPLIKFRSVSKPWKSLIDSSEFILAHTIRHNHPQHLLLKYEDLIETEDKYVSFVDDETFLKQRFVPTLPLSIKPLKFSVIVGSSRGLLCLYGYHWGPENSHQNLKTAKSVIWNPSIRKSIVVDVPNMLYGAHEAVVGFGVSPVANDPTIVEITQLRSWVDIVNETINFWKVKVYTMSSGKWRTLSTNLPYNSIRVTWSQVVIDKFIYWLGFHMVTEHTHNLIMSFDMSNESFKVVDLPDSLAYHPQTELSVCKLRESLAMVQYDDDKTGCGVWVMENGVQRLFTKVFMIRVPHGSMRTLGFRKRGQPVIEVRDDVPDSSEVAVYEPDSGGIKDLAICGMTHSFSVNFFTESLVLLDRSDCSSY